jgi:hypothetical protein
MSNLFKTLEIEAFRAGITPRTRESREWFRQKAQQLRRVNRNQLMKEEELELRNRVGTKGNLVGNMYMFFYDPKLQKELPYYDAFPLVIVIGPAKGGFMGLNLHYLPPTLRARFLDSLLDITSNKKYDETTRFRLSYSLLKRAAKYKFFKPCIKHYLNDHVRSRFAFVPAPEWEIATFLPTADWRKSSANKVYSDSRGML